MVDLSITAANVKFISGSKAAGTSGEAITAGQTVYLASSDSKYYKADANDATKDELAGIALNSAPGADQPIDVQTGGIIEFQAAATTIGQIYVLSDTAGGIMPEADLAVGVDYVSIVGIGNTTQRIDMSIKNSGVLSA